MPYASKAQMAYMHARHPKIASRWDREYKVPKDLPKKKTGTRLGGGRRKT